MNLSEQRKRLFETLNLAGEFITLEKCNKQDKEFIKKLKEEINKLKYNMGFEDGWISRSDVEHIINNLAGKELVE